MPEEFLSADASLAPEAGARLGFYGKLPARGDFLGRRLPRSFIDPWDSWLQQAIAESRTALGEEWLGLYLTGPIWRFVLGPGLCGAETWAGLVMPSVDRVGRYFPLTLAVAVPGCRAPMRLALAAAEWFEQAEDLALGALEDGADFDRFDAAVAEMAPPPLGDAVPARRGAGAVSLDLAELGAAGAAAPELVDGLLGLAPQYSLWWTAGSERVRPSFVAAFGLPPLHGFAALLDGAWERWGWNQP